VRGVHSHPYGAKDEDFRTLNSEILHKQELLKTGEILFNRAFGGKIHITATRTDTKKIRITK